MITVCQIGSPQILEELISDQVPRSPLTAEICRMKVLWSTLIGPSHGIMIIRVIQSSIAQLAMRCASLQTNSKTIQLWIWWLSKVAVLSEQLNCLKIWMKGEWYVVFTPRIRFMFPQMDDLMLKSPQWECCHRRFSIAKWENWLKTGTIYYDGEK